MVVELDKFFRCPNCQSYSLSKSRPKLNEKILALFVPVYVYKCSNCSYRYVEKDYDFVRGRLKKTVFFVVIPLILLSILYFSGIFSGKEQNKKITKNNTPVEITKNNKIKEKGNTAVNPIIKNNSDKNSLKGVNNHNGIKTDNSDKNNSKTESILKEDNSIINNSDVKLIVFGNSKKYGVNWKTVDKGIEIYRISINGVFYRGGIRKGDILFEVDGEKIVKGDKLNKAREEIFKGNKKFADIKVLRKNEELVFRLIRVKEIKVFSRSSLKVRSSHPKEKNEKFKWSFNNKIVEITRTEKQKVYIAGNISGTENWAVDDTIMINGKVFKGIKEGKSIKGRAIDNERKLKPLDITDFIMVDKPVKLNIQLINHGIHFGNSDIYIVIK